MTMIDMHSSSCPQCKMRAQFYEKFSSDSKKNVSYFGVISYINNRYVMPVSSDESKKEPKNGQNYMGSNICFLQLTNEWSIRDLISKSIKQKNGLLSRHSNGIKRKKGPKPSFYQPEHTGKLISIKKSESFTIKKSESFTESSPEDTVCSDNSETTKIVYKCKSPKKSPSKRFLSSSSTSPSKRLSSSSSTSPSKRLSSSTSPSKRLSSSTSPSKRLSSSTSPSKRLSSSTSPSKRLSSSTSPSKRLSSSTSPSKRFSSSPTTSTSKEKVAPKEPKIGTLKRKRWNLEKLKPKETYEDDLFAEKKFKPIPVDDSNCEEDKLKTPVWSVPISPCELSRSPSYEDCYSLTDLQNSRKDAEEYQFRRNKWKKSTSVCEKDDPEAVMKKDPATYETLVGATAKLEKECEINYESDEDYWFSDAEDSKH